MSRSVFYRVLVSTLAFVGVGCRSVQLSAGLGEASGSGVSAIAEIDIQAEDSRWPARWGDGQFGNRGTIIDLDPSAPLRPIHLSRFHQFRSTDIEYDDANQLAADLGMSTGFKFKPEGPGSFVFIPNPKNTVSPFADPIQDPGTLDESNTPELAFKFVSATKIEPDDSFEAVLEDSATDEKKRYVLIRVNKDKEAPARIISDEDHVELQRTWFQYRDPMEKEPQLDPIGTIVLLPGMFGTPDLIVDGLEKYWRHQGYAILRMRSQPSRFTQHKMFKVADSNEASVAREAAEINDDRVAEGAYATKAALDHMYSLRPNLEGKPVVLVGMSGGAMMLPTVYAYAPELYDGAVLIAGGADFLTIAVESNYKSWIDAMVFDFNKPTDDSFANREMGKPTAEQLETLSSVYLEHSKLDAYHTATEMKDTPVLMLHGTADKAVPSSTGDLLYQQLGQPERWSYPIGHELIFAGLPTQVTRINKWITEHVLEAQDD